MPELATIWFILLAVIFCIYFFLEGFDFGVDLLRPFIAKTEAEKRTLIGTIGPFWDGNEVWVILGAGVMFAAFPKLYGTLFSALYLIFVLIILALIGRGISFEFRSQRQSKRWLAFWDFTSFVGALLPSFFWGVVMANLIRGLPINAEGNFVGGFTDIFNTFTLFGGFSSLFLFMLHGATFLLLRLHKDSVLHERARRMALFWGFFATFTTLIFVYMGYVSTNLFRDFGLVPWLFPLAAFATLVSIWFALVRGRDALSFVMSGLTISLSTATIFLGLYPELLPSSLSPNFTLTVANAASQPHTLELLSVASLIFLPLILGYQAYTYYAFRHRLHEDEHE